MNTRTACGIVIYAEKEHVIRNCGAPSTHALIVRGDQLFSVCSRHNRRLERAFPKEFAARSDERYERQREVSA